MSMGLRHAAASVAVIALTTGMATSALAAQVCAAPERAVSPDTSAETSTEAAGKTRKHPVTDPGQRRLNEGDSLRRNGRMTEAEGIYRQLISYPAEKRQIARKAELRVAQMEIQRDNFGAARVHIDHASRPGALPQIKAEAAHLRRVATFEETSNQAQARLAAIDARRDANAPAAELLPAYRELLAIPCPYPDDFRARAHERLAQVNADAGQFKLAYEEIDLAFAEVPRDPPTRAKDISARLNQRRIDFHGGELLAQADTLPNDDEKPRRALFGQVLDMKPPVSPPMLARTHLRIADSLARDARFDEARAELEQASLLVPADDATGQSRLADGRQRIAQREIDFNARTRAEEIGAAADRHPRQAIADYRTLLKQEPAPSPNVSESIRLSLADVLRKEHYFREAHEIADAARAQSVSDKSADRIVRLEDRLQADAPDQSLHGRASIGTFYDSNVPALVSELRLEEDDTGYPLNRKFDDGVIELGARLTHMKRLDGNFDYWRTEVRGYRTFQFDLTNLDRTMIDVYTGPLFNLADQRATLQVAGRFSWEDRGGHFLRTLYGIEVDGTREFDNQLVALGHLALLHNNDVRQDLDGTYFDVAAGIQFPVGPRMTLAPSLRYQRRDLRSDDLDTNRYGVGLSYNVNWVRETIQYGLSISPDYQWIEYDQPHASGPRHDSKFNLDSEAWVRFSNNYRLAVEYRHLNAGSNIDNLNRLPDDRAGITLAYIF